MSDIIDINVNKIVETIDIVANFEHPNIEITAIENVDNVEINATPNVVQININTISGGSAEWGEIEGNLSDQTDLQGALDLKADAIDLDNLVPYTGATQNVDLGEYQIKAGQVEFDTTPTGTSGVGVMSWNDSDGTLDLGLKGGNVTLQLGQEQLVRAVNKTATNITLLESNYQAVRVTGAQGQRLKVDLALATNDLLSAETIGLVTETIANNQEGFITVSGLVRNINTTGSLQGETWEDGDVLYLSPSIAGRITNIKPTAPNHLVVIGYVVYAHANNGKIFVKVNNGYELEELHNVTETNYTTPIDTDSLLTFDITNSLWKRLSWSNIKSNLKTYFDTIYQATLGFTPENVANKATNLTSPDNTKYPTTQTVVDGLATKLDKSTTPSSVYGTDASGEQTMIPLDSLGGDSETFNQSTWMFSDFYSENLYQPPFNCSALGGGSKDVAVFSDSTQDYLGSFLLFSGTSANGGYRIIDTSNPAFGGFRVYSNLTFYGVFKLINQSDARDRVIRIGFHNATNHVAPAHGCFLEILGSTAYFKTRSSSVETSSSGVSLISGSLVGGKFYKVLIEFISTTSVNCKLVDNSGNVVLNVNHTTNIPTTGQRFGCGLTATITTAGSSHQIMTIDYMGVGRQKPNFLNDF